MPDLAMISLRRVTGVVLAGVGLHWVLCLLAPSSWWVPDVTLVSVVMVISIGPAHWWAAAGLAGLLTMAWMIDFPFAVMLWYGALGVTVFGLSAVWNLEDLRTQRLMVAAAEGLWILFVLWLGDVPVAPIAAAAALRVALTVLIVPVARRIVAGPVAAAGRPIPTGPSPPRGAI